MNVNNSEIVEYVTCNQCGWVHMGVSREYALKEVEKFNKFYDTLTEREQEEYYGNRKASLLTYEVCMVCRSSYKDFRPSVEGDCPEGCTINPILHFME